MSGRTKLCREGVYYLLMVSAVFGWALIREANLLLLVAGVLCAPLLLNWWFCKSSLRGIEARRRVVRSVTAGLPLHVELELRNRRRRRGSWGLTVQDQLVRESGEGHLPAMQPRIFVLSLPPGQQRRERYRLVLPRRGRYRFGPLVLASRFPFGLFCCLRVLPAADVLTVYPRPGTLSPAWRRRYDPRRQGERGTHRPGRAAGDFYAVREWQVGDSARWIHWRRSARQGELIVRQFEQPGDCRLVLLLDLWQPARQPQDRENFELAISFAATVVADLCRQPGLQLRVGLTGQTPEWISGPASLSLMARVLERLAVAEAGQRDQLDALLKLGQEQVPEQAEVLVVSPRADLRSGEDGSLPVPGRFSGPVRVMGPTDAGFGEFFKVN
jgi:uncharacterized protein (DUF58 family)